MINILNKPLLTLVTPASIKKGDHKAFQELHNDLHIKGFRFLLKKVCDHDDAKDLT